MTDVSLHTWAPRLGESVPGVPLIRSVPSLGWGMVRIRGRCWVETAMPDDERKKVLYENFQRFVKWQESEGKIFKRLASIGGPEPHLADRRPDIQYGDAGGQRLVARTLASDIDYGREDYFIDCDFLVREHVELMALSDAREVVGQDGTRPLNEGRWKDVEGAEIT